MKSQHPLDQDILEQSSEWIETLRRGGAAEQEAFSRWLLESKEHIHHFLLMSAVDEELRHFDPQRRLEVKRLMHAETDDDSVDEMESATAWQEPLPARARFPGRTLSWWTLSAVAAVLALVLVGLNVVSPSETATEWKDYQTGAGEQNTITLPDGSKVNLNARSHISTRISGERRDVRVMEGEALFTVAADQARRFRVRVGQNELEDLGTQFNVNSYEKAFSIVSVVEGSVRVLPHTLENRLRRWANLGPVGSTVSAGQQVRLDSEGHARIEASPDVQATVLWTTGILKFEDAPVSEVVKQFNRYNRTQIRLAEPQMGLERRGGAFRVDDPKSLADLVAREHGWIVETAPDGTIVIRESNGK